MDEIINNININNKTFVFNNPINFTIEQEIGYYVINYEYLDILAYAKSEEEALENFNIEFDMLWDSYALEEDDNLTYDAILLKQKLLQMVKEVY